MALSRRAQPVTPTPETRRASDFYRPVTTAAYGTAIPWVCGQDRVPATLIRDGSKPGPVTGAAVDGKAHLGLCEGPIQSIRRKYSNKTTTDLGLATGAQAHFADSDSLPWLELPAGDTDASVEVSTETPLAGGVAAYVPGTVAADSGENALGDPLQVSDCHVCTTGTGASAVQYLVVWSEVGTKTLKVYKRTVGGSWGAGVALVSASVNSSLLPAENAAPQPRVAAVGNLVHVVFSRLSQLAEPVSVEHLWSTDGGTTWTVGQSLVPQTKSSAAGIGHLGISLHSSGELWVCLQKRNADGGPCPWSGNTCGIVVGFLPSSATASTAWVIPDTSVRPNGNGWAGELCLFDSSSDWILFLMNIQMLRAPSVVALGSGKAMLSCTWATSNVAMAANLYVLPIKADTLVRWDLAAAAFDLMPSDPYPHSNVASISWLAAHNYPSKALGYAGPGYRYTGPGYRYTGPGYQSGQDAYNQGSTQIVCDHVDGDGSPSLIVLVNDCPVNRPAQYLYDAGDGIDRAADIPAGVPDRTPWGAWRVLQAKHYLTGSNSPQIYWATDHRLATLADPGFAPSLFWGGSMSKAFVSMGLPGARGGLFWESWNSPEIQLYSVDLAADSHSQILDYSPATGQRNSVAYQHWAQNGEIVALWREKEDGTHLNCGVRVIDLAPGNGDVLPSVICKRLLVGDPQRGLAIRGLTIDPATWGKFDDYCAAMGIKFSLTLTSQEAAWPLVVRILESANAVPFRSQGMLKVYVRETATITGNGTTYTPLPEHSGPVATIPSGYLRDGIKIAPDALDQRWNQLTVNWKNRNRAYADEPTTVEDAGSKARLGQTIPASACDWPWIKTPEVATTCAWLRMRHQSRTGRSYSFAVLPQYMLLEPGDIVTIGDGQIPARTVRLLRVEEPVGGWIEMTAEDVVVSSTAAAPPGPAGGGLSSSTVSVITPVNLPIIFVALIGGLLQVWCLLSGGPGWRGCTVQASWDGGSHWEQVGACTVSSPTGWLVQDMATLRVGLGQVPHPDLCPGLADYALADFSESGALPEWPSWGAFQAGEVGALLWVDGELCAFASESDDGSAIAQCSILRHGLYGTAPLPHPIHARVGVVTDAAVRFPVPAGRAGATCLLRFPSAGEIPANVPTYSVGIPA